jgi:hypothetical protein
MSLTTERSRFIKVYVSQNYIQIPTWKSVFWGWPFYSRVYILWDISVYCHVELILLKIVFWKTETR